MSGLLEMFGEDYRKEGLSQGIRKGRAEGLSKGIMKGRVEGRAEGLTEGREETRVETAKNLLKEKVDLKLIQRVTKLPLKEIKKLKAEP